MVRCLRFCVNCETGEVTEEWFEMEEETLVEPKGIDFEKLKQVLLEAGIITDSSQIEGTRKIEVR